jgi:hypothetical protein
VIATAVAAARRRNITENDFGLWVGQGRSMTHLALSANATKTADAVSTNDFEQLEGALGFNGNRQTLKNYEIGRRARIGQDARGMGLFDANRK